MPALAAELRSLTSISARALEFAVLTAARSGGALGARWDEIDLNRRIWFVPEERIKGRKEHRVPLAPRAVEILDEMAVIQLNEFVFFGAKQRRPLSNMAMLMLLRDLRPGVTVHGFRSAFKDWASEATRFPDYLSEAALAHASADKVRAAYARSDLFEKRRKLWRLGHSTASASQHRQRWCHCSGGSNDLPSPWAHRGQEKSHDHPAGAAAPDC